MINDKRDGETMNDYAFLKEYARKKNLLVGQLVASINKRGKFHPMYIQIVLSGNKKGGACARAYIQQWIDRNKADIEQTLGRKL